MEPNNKSIWQKIDTMAEQLAMLVKIFEKAQPPQQFPKKLNLDEAIQFMTSEGCNISKSAAYKYTSTNNIPFQRSGRKLSFDKDELLKWCQERLTSSNLENTVITDLAAAANKKHNHGK